MSDEYNDSSIDNSSIGNNLIDTELQVRLMNLVMGEASDFERDQLLLLMEKRPELAAYFQHLEHLHGLLGEVGAGEPAIDIDLATVDADWRLPADRRERVLAVLENRSSAPPEKVTLANKRSFRNWRITTMEIVVVASIACVLLGLLLPATQSARVAARRFSISGGAADSYRMAEMAPSSTAANRPAVGRPLNTILSESEPVAPSAATMDFLSRPNSFAENEKTRGLGNESKNDTEIVLSKNENGVAGESLPSPYYLSDDVQYFPANPERKMASEPPSSGTVDGLAVQNGRQSYGEMQLGQGKFGGLAVNGENDMGRRGAVAAGLHGDNVDGRTPRLGLGADVSREGIPMSGELANKPGSAKHWALDKSDSKKLTDRTTDPAKRSTLWEDNQIAGSLYSRVESPLSEVKAREESESDANQILDAVTETTPKLSVLEQDQSETINGAYVPEVRNKMPESVQNDRVESKLNSNVDYSNIQMLVPMLPPNSEQPIGYPTEDVWRELSNRRSERYGNIVETPGRRDQLDEVSKFDSVQSTVTVPNGGSITLGGINRLFKNNVSDTSTLMMTVTPRIIIPEEEKVALGEVASAPSPEIASKDRVEQKKDAKPFAPKQPVTLDEQSASAEAFSTFSLHVSDVSFKLAHAALSQSQWPEAAKIRIEEFVNAMDYHDPLPSGDQKIACRVEQAIHPFLMQRNLLRVSMRTAVAGRSQKTPLRLTLLLDNSGSMERPDRRQAVLRAFQTLTQQLKATDQITLISFASTPRLLADKVLGNQGETLLQLIATLPSEGGTNIESALQLAREKAAEQQVAGAQNRIVLLTDGAVNLGDANPENLAKQVTQMRDAGIAFDAAGISAQDLNDEVLEALTRQGDGRYYLLDSAEAASDSFAAQIAGSLRPSAQNVKVQVEFNPLRVGRYKLLGYEKHRLHKEDFRNDQVDAAEMAAAEAGVAVYQFEIKPKGSGDVGSVSVRFRDLSTGQMVERRWPILYESNTPRLEQSQPSMQLATAAALFAAKLGGGPLADSVDLAQLQSLLAKLPEQFASQPRVQQLRAMIEQAIAIH